MSSAHLWNALYDASLEDFVNEDCRFRSFSMIFRVLQLQFDKLKIQLGNSNCTCKKAELKIYEEIVEQKNIRSPLSVLVENTIITPNSCEKNYSIFPDEDLLSHKISVDNLNSSKENDKSLFTDDSVKEIEAPKSPTLNKSKRFSRRTKETDKNASLSNCIIFGTPVLKIKKVKKLKQSKLITSSDNTGSLNFFHEFSKKKQANNFKKSTNEVLKIKSPVKENYVSMVIKDANFSKAFSGASKIESPVNENSISKEIKGANFSKNISGVLKFKSPVKENFVSKEIKGVNFSKDISGASKIISPVKENFSTKENGGIHFYKSCRDSTTNSTKSKEATVFNQSTNKISPSNNECKNGSDDDDEDGTMYFAVQKPPNNAEKNGDSTIANIPNYLAENTSNKSKKIKLDNSFDCVPEKKNESPDYEYKHDPVRKKSERDKLQGWDCPDCEKYYAYLKRDLSEEEIKKIMNKCSKHRSKYNPRILTPEGFWNPDFSPTQDKSLIFNIG